MTSLGTLHWAHALHQTPCAVRGGEVIFAATNASEQAALHAFTLDGRELWARTFEQALIVGLETSEVSSESSWGKAERAETSEVFVALSSADLLRGEGMVLAVNADGQEVWRWPSGGQKVSAPAVVAPALRGAHPSTPQRKDAAPLRALAIPQGRSAVTADEIPRLYLTVDTKTLVCLDVTTGNEMQRWPLLYPASASVPLVTADAIYVSCRGPQVLAYNLNGQLRWQFVHDDAAAWLDQTPVVIGDLLIVVSTRGEVLVLDRLSGALKQRVQIGSAGKSLSTPTTDGARVFIGARDGLYVLDAQTGEVTHWLTTDRRVEAAPVIVDDVVYVSGHDHQLVALDRATGRELWRWVAPQRIEIAPLVSADRTTVFVADHAGHLSAVRRPLTADELAAAGRWAEAAEAYRQRGQPVKQAEALMEAARQVEAAGQLEQAGVLWQQAEQLFVQAEQLDRAQECRRAVLRCRQQPVLIVEARYRDLQPNVWSLLEFVVRNDGFGPARNLVIHALGDQFKGDVMQTRQIATVLAGRSHVEQLDICPLGAGHVPLRVRAEYADHAGVLHSLEQKIYIDVALHTAVQTINVFTAAQLQPVDISPWLDVELRLSHEAEAYRVELTLRGEQHFTGRLSADVAAWVPSGDPQADGHTLFNALCADPKVRAGWGLARGKSKQRRLRFRIDPVELHTLPWELLCDDDDILAADADTPFSRYLPVSKEWGRASAMRPIRVLAAISTPTDLEAKSDLPQADVFVETSTLRAALRLLPSPETGEGPGVRLDFLEAPITLERLEERLRQGYHILHFVGHGAFNAKDRQAALLLQNDDGTLRRVLDDEIAGMLDRLASPPQLIVLAACQSARQSMQAAFSGLGPKLVQIGVPAVVAMQDDVTVLTARKFGATFYRRLLEHGTVDLAMNEARSTLITNGRYDAAVPVLFMRLRDGRLLNITANAASRERQR